MSNSTEYRSAAWESNQDGRITGYAVVFNSRTVLYKDPDTGIEYGEVIDGSALNGADLSDVVLRVNHEGKVLARTRNNSLKLTIDGNGLRIDADMTGSAESREVYEAVKNGLYDKMSFAFIVSDEDYDRKTNTRKILQISKLYDVAIVDFPAYDKTELSARAKYTDLAIDDRKAFYTAENRKTMAEIDEIISCHDLENRTSAFYVSDPDIRLTEREKLELRMVEIRERCQAKIAGNNSLLGSDPVAELREIEHQLTDLQGKRSAILDQVSTGQGTVVAAYPGSKTERKITTMDELRNKFYNELIEKRAAAGTSGMANVIPVDIVNQAFRTGTNGLLSLVSMSHIKNSGNVKIPYFSDTSTAVSAHTENAAITAGNFIPNVVTINHAEYQQLLGYSYLGMDVAISDLRNIIETALMGAMSLKLDSVALGAIDGLTWVTTAGATKNAVQWETSGAPLLSEILDLMKLLPAQYSSGAKFIMNKATILSVIQNSTGNLDSDNSNAMYNISVLDGLTRLFGTQVVEDSNLADGVIFYGKPDAVHVNIAGEVELADWLDRDSLTEKFQVACAAGAGCEVGAFVKGANSFS